LVKAFVSLHRALYIQPDNHRTLSNLGELYAMIYRYQLKSAIHLEEMMLAEVLEQEMLKKRARKYFKASLQIEDSKELREGLAMVS